ncbi:MAG: dTDP-4-dehydrorhamnose 3,5-epimerase [Chloroflexota bacterium]|nr:dTDP-4-dehydrorhamnose 3,5-epimerase [Chloroflexota bacterium]
MIFHPLGVAGAFLVDLEPIADERGLFARIWDEAEFAAQGIDIRCVQTNVSYNRRRGTVRGLHWQVEPYSETKLLRCTKGSVFDVVADVRPGSETYGCWAGQRLTPGERSMVFVPAGCAHGYQALEDDSEVSYQVSHPYVAGAEKGVRWNDPSLQIDWPINEGVIVSPKDAAWPDMEPAPLPDVAARPARR